MATETPTEVYDLLILVDATYSMFNYLEALKTSLPKVISISKLTNSFARIGLLAYRDYSEAEREKDGMLEWSGWYSDDPDLARRSEIGTATADTLMAMAASLEPIGGGDYPEATKTGLARAHEVMREDATTMILLYTDAPPHCWMVADKDPGSNYFAEQAALNKTSSYGGFGPYFVDWVAAAKQLHHGPRKAHVFCFLDGTLGPRAFDAGYYTYLSTVTRGACLYLTDEKPHSIAQLTVDLLLAWMGVGKAGAEKIKMPGKLVRFKSGSDIKKIKSEKDVIANQYFWAYNEISKHASTRFIVAADVAKVKEQMQANVAEVSIDSDILRAYLPKKKTLVPNFAQWYSEDERYRKVVVEQLRRIIEVDVTSMSLNPVFGALWRAVCNDRDNAARDELITSFSLYVDKIKDADEKTRMKNWLEESYDYAAEILEALDKVSMNERFPCVFLDPTIKFEKALEKGEKEDDEMDEQNRPVTAFRRDELLELGRSCDGRILRRLGKVLTQVTYAESAADLPAHIAATTDAEVPKIPTALASKEYGWKFWKMLLHVVLPGTMLSARPSVVLAALAIRIGLKPLFGAASAAMLFWRDRWNNLEVPETWNASCLGLLLDADAEYRKRGSDSEDEAAVKDGLLLDPDRELFSQLIAYKHAEANLLTTLSADIGWTPEKTAMAVGPVVKCPSCGYPRSITIMAESTGGKCGLCVGEGWRDAEHKKSNIHASVTKEDTEASRAIWVECNVRTCRAQYVCYNPDGLNVRAKCHFCRTQGNLSEDQRSDDPAPTLECEKCLNKVIWPGEWRALAPTPFNCTACLNGRETIVPIETNASQICKENGQAWLLQNKNDTLKDPFKRSLFYTVTSSGPSAFLANVRILPTLTPEPVLRLRGKQIRNQAALVSSLASWVQRRTAERTHCSLCFSTFPNARLSPACRRRGCHQKICEACLNGWYGLNKPGSMINTAALFCPFCRRPPAARTLAAYGKGVHAVGNIRTAVEERGHWIHAWCCDCGKAQRYMERVCARGALEPEEKWKCETCMLSDLELARIAEQEAREAYDLTVNLDVTERTQARQEAQHRLWLAERRHRELKCPVKECPGCKIPTQKTVGCDHMECPLCSSHWCWSCGKKESSDTIYAHMAAEHGGWETGEEGLGFEVDYQD